MAESKLILIHSNAPWVPSGYGTQCALLARALRDLGHRVVISAFYGLQGAATTWEGITVLPGGQAEYGADVLAPHAKSVEADLVILLMDAWAMPESAILGVMLARIPVAAWMPVDVERQLGVKDQAILEGTRMRPIAMSEHGRSLLVKAGFRRTLYVPHMIDMEEFRPLSLAERRLVREDMGISPETFVIGINAQNKDPWGRKGWFELFEAFRMFHAGHPNSLLAIHCSSKGGIDLERMRDRLGLKKVVRFTDWYRSWVGLNTANDLMGWYNALDLYAGPSMAEGFGLPHAEAQACGVPVVATNGSAMREVCRDGWLVDGQLTWSAGGGHASPWVRVSIPGLVKVFELAAAKGRPYQVKRSKARTSVERYELGHVIKNYWVPALRELGVG